MGYGDKQIAELSETIAAVPCDSVLIATPIDLGHVLKLEKPNTRAIYELDEQDKDVLPREIMAAIERWRSKGHTPAQVGHVAR